MKKLLLLLIITLVCFFGCEDDDSARNSYNCADSGCVESPNGYYLNLEDCESNCNNNNNDNSITGYSCSNSVGCYQSENSQYSTLEDCEKNCAYFRYNCENVGCIEEITVGPTLNSYITLEDCENSCDAICGQFKLNSLVTETGTSILCCTGNFDPKNPVGTYWDGVCGTISLDCDDLKYDMEAPHLTLFPPTQYSGYFTNHNSEIIMNPPIEFFEQVIIIDTNTLHAIPDDEKIDEAADIIGGNFYWEYVKIK